MEERTFDVISSYTVGKNGKVYFILFVLILFVGVAVRISGFTKFLNKIEHRDLRRQVTTRDEAKRSEQTLPTAEIRNSFAAAAGMFL